MTFPCCKGLREQLWRLLPGGTVALAALALMPLGAFELLETFSYRGQFQLRGPIAWDDRIVLITVDDATLAALDQYPPPRDIYARLLEQLAGSDPAAIGFNLLFTESTLADATFAQAMSDQGTVILATGLNEQGQPLLPSPPLAAAALGTGHLLSQTAPDGLVHQIQPLAFGETAIAITLADAYSLTRSPVSLPPLDRPLWVNWPGPAESLAQYSLIEVLNRPPDPDAFNDKLILVGMSATGIDALPTPFDRNPPASGLWLHAAVLDNLIRQRPLSLVNGAWLWLLLLLAQPALSYALTGWPLRSQLLAIALCMVGWLGGSALLFQTAYQLWPTTTPIALFGLTGAATLVGQRLRENWTLRRLLDALWHYHRQDPALLAGLSPHLAVPDHLGQEVRKLALLADSLGRTQAAQTALAQTLSVGILAVNDHDRVWFCNTLATEWLGLTLGDALTPALVPHWLDQTSWQRARADVLQKSTVVSFEHQQGHTWLELQIQALGQPNRPSLLLPLRQGYLLLIEDITARKTLELQLRSQNQGLTAEVQQQSRLLERSHLDLQQEILGRQQMQAELVHQALFDTLTGLPNRYQFMVQLRARLVQNQAQFAVLFLDCDRFKLVNDSLGHLVGDELLKAIAKRLRSCIAADDLVARFGGDEFTILLTIQTPDTAIQVVRRIQERLHNPFFIQNHRLYAGCSIGIVVSSPRYSQAEEMLRDADTAMYRAKRGGSGYALFELEMHLAAHQSLQLEVELRQALDRNQLAVHYQPIFDIKTCQIQGFEALLRWHHPTHGQVSPEQFIPIAEETGLIVPIGEWVMQSACQQLRIWQQQRQLLPDTFISVNLSMQQFAQPDLVHRINTVLETSRLDGKYLKLEITESVIMANSDFAIQMIQSLKEQGIRIGIDDFGTGYSSLSYLHCFPIDVLKVDRSFIHRITSGAKHLSLVQAINTLAHHFEIVVIAEGIETQTQLELLDSIDCPMGQGFFFSPPIDPTTLEAKFLTLI